MNIPSAKLISVLLHYPSLSLYLPLVAKGINLIGKFCQFFIWSTLIFADYCNQPLACCHKTCKYIRYHFRFLVDKNRHCFIFNLIRQQVKYRSAVGCICLDPMLRPKTLCKALAYRILSVYYKNAPGFFFKSLYPFKQSVLIRMP